MVLGILLGVLKARTEVLTLLLSKATDQQAITIVQRYLDDTEWIHRLLAKLSDRIEARIKAEDLAPTKP